MALNKTLLTDKYEDLNAGKDIVLAQQEIIDEKYDTIETATTTMKNAITGANGDFNAVGTTITTQQDIIDEAYADIISANATMKDAYLDALDAEQAIADHIIAELEAVGGTDNPMAAIIGGRPNTRR